MSTVHVDKKAELDEGVGKLQLGCTVEERPGSRDILVDDARDSRFKSTSKQARKA